MVSSDIYVQIIIIRIFFNKGLVMGNKIGAGIAIIIMLFLAVMYLFGAYKLFVDDRYSKGEMIIGIVAVPYPIYIGIDNTFFTTDKE